MTAIVDHPDFPGFPRFVAEDFAGFMLFVYCQLESLNERLERIEVRLLEEQFAHPSAPGGNNG